MGVHGGSIYIVRKGQVVTARQPGQRHESASMIRKTVSIVFVAFLSAPVLRAQSSTPIVSGAVQFAGTTTGGSTFFQPTHASALAAPARPHWLIESRAGIQGFLARHGWTSGSYQGQLTTTMDYFQVRKRPSRAGIDISARYKGGRPTDACPRDVERRG